MGIVTSEFRLMLTSFLSFPLLKSHTQWQKVIIVPYYITIHHHIEAKCENRPLWSKKEQMEKHTGRGKWKKLVISNGVPDMDMPTLLYITLSACLHPLSNYCQRLNHKIVKQTWCTSPASPSRWGVLLLQDVLIWLWNSPKNEKTIIQWDLTQLTCKTGFNMQHMLFANTFTLWTYRCSSLRFVQSRLILKQLHFNKDIDLVMIQHTSSTSLTKTLKQDQCHYFLLTEIIVAWYWCSTQGPARSRSWIHPAQSVFSVFLWRSELANTSHMYLDQKS